MKRDAILLIVMLLLVVSVSDEAATPSNVDVFDSSKFVISQTEMLSIYELITPEVNQSQTQYLARTLFGLTDALAEEVEGRYVVSSGNRSFEVSTQDGSIWYADYDKLWNVSLGIEVPTPEDCQAAADAWLREKGLLPANAVFANIGNTTASAYNPDAGESRSKILQYHVNYEFVIDDIPVTGEAAQISVMIGEGGDTLGFNWKWRAIQPEVYATSEKIEYDSILEAYGIPSSEVVDHRLVYTTDEDGDSELLYPVWEIEVFEYEEDLEIISLLHIDATLFDPVVEIVTPSAGISVMPGQSVTFDCSVSFGTPPYTYEWRSDFDGPLSTSKTFSIMTLSEVLKKGTPVPHAISIQVRDAENRWTRDIVAVTVEEVDFLPDTTLTITVAAGAFVLVAALLVLRRRKGGFALLFLLMMFSAFMFLPVTFASGEMSNVRQFTPSAPTGAYDDGVKEVGIEWVGLSHNKPLPNTETNIEGFYNWMSAFGGYSQEFNWGEYSAWEEDFKDAAFSGTDTEWVDAVDFVYYQDHGGPNGVAFTSQHDDTSLEYSSLRLGDGDLESIVFDACSPLAWENKNGVNVFDRWGPALQGIHQILSFATTSQNSAVRGTKFALYMTGLSIILPGVSIVNAWFRATAETEGSDRLAAVFYASKSADPWNPQLDDPINDHAYGFGYVCSDPVPGTFSWYVYITSSC